MAWKDKAKNMFNKAKKNEKVQTKGKDAGQQAKEKFSDKKGNSSKK